MAATLASFAAFLSVAFAALPVVLLQHLPAPAPSPKWQAGPHRPGKQGQAAVAHCVVHMHAFRVPVAFSFGAPGITGEV